MDPCSTRIFATGLALVVPALVSCASAEGPRRDVHAMYVESLQMDERTDTPVIVLRERDGDERELPIWIGLAEARSIALAMEEMSSPRPNTHDLIKNLLEGLNGDLRRVVITELRDHTYYAVIRVALDGREVEVDSRPSDAIAVAIRTGAPVFATDEVLVQGSEDGSDEPRLDIDWRGRDEATEGSPLRAH